MPFASSSYEMAHRDQRRQAHVRACRRPELGSAAEHVSWKSDGPLTSLRGGAEWANKYTLDIMRGGSLLHIANASTAPTLRAVGGRSPGWSGGAP